jgi:hypothetical protein
VAIRPSRRIATPVKPVKLKEEHRMTIGDGDD